MKSALVSAIIAAVVAGGVIALDDVFESDDDDSPRATPAIVPADVPAAAQAGTMSLSYTDELPEDVWVNGARTAGSDRRSLADADHSICFLTKVEITGVQGPEDSNSCVIAVDGFTGFWQLIVTVEEGGQSEVRCNARCLAWE